MLIIIVVPPPSMELKLYVVRPLYHQESQKLLGWSHGHEQRLGAVSRNTYWGVWIYNRDWTNCLTFTHLEWWTYTWCLETLHVFHIESDQRILQTAYSSHVLPAQLNPRQLLPHTCCLHAHFPFLYSHGSTHEENARVAFIAHLSSRQKTTT